MPSTLIRSYADVSEYAAEVGKWKVHDEIVNLSSLLVD